jgi:choline dehydrogenase-like flavoprotein
MFDVLIIGSGASGAAAAWSLSRNGNLKILCLEQGERVDPSKYPSSRVNWELDRENTASSDPNVRRNKADYPIDCSNSAVSLANFNGFGGSTILYSGHFPRFHPSDFATHSLDQVGYDWPLTYNDLEPYFQLNERMMGISGLVGDTAYPDYLSLLPPVPIGEGGETLARGFNTLGWHWWPSYAAINTKAHGGRAPCINLGPCNTGCSQGAKASVDLTYWPLAIKQGVEVRTGCQVVHIETHTQNGKDRVSGVWYIDDLGNKHFAPSKVVVVAASGIGTPRLLLQSKSERFPNGLLNNHDVVGRNLMVHPLAYVEGQFDSNLKSSLGPQGCCILSQEFYETRPEHDFVRGYTLQILRGSAPVETAVKNFTVRRLPIGPEHHQYFNKLFNHNMGIAVITEDLPEWENRVQLDLKNLDLNGMPGLICNYHLSTNTKNMLKHGIERSKEVIKASGGKVTYSFGPVRHTGWHLMGTTRMGLNPKNSVVNSFGQAHDIANLFIVDSSIFVTSGAVNPVATAQALTLHCCNYLQKYFTDITSGSNE